MAEETVTETSDAAPPTYQPAPPVHDVSAPPCNVKELWVTVEAKKNVFPEAAMFRTAVDVSSTTTFRAETGPEK